MQTKPYILQLECLLPPPFPLAKQLLYTSYKPDIKLEKNNEHNWEAIRFEKRGL